MSADQHLAPNRKEAERFLCLLDEDAEGFTFQTFDDSKHRGDKSLNQVLHGTLNEHWPKLCQLNQVGAGVFVTVQETDLRGRKKRNITGVRAIFQEQDRPGCPELPTVPHIEVESSPGKHHRYILVEDCPLGDFGSLQDRMVESYGSDPNAKDITRVLRLPGFLHQKDPNKPHMVRIVSESGSPPLPYTEAVQTFPPVVRKRRPVPATKDTPADGSPPADLEEVQSALAALDPDMEYGEWLQVGMALHDWAGGTTVGLEVWDTWSNEGGSYRAGECAYKWSTFTFGGGLTINTIFHMAREAGWRHDPAADFANILDPDRDPAEPIDVAKEIQKLAKLSQLEYEQIRVTAAKALNMRTTILDQHVARERGVGEEEANLPFEIVTPWPDTVDGAQLLSDIATTIQRFIVCSPEVANAAALWVTMTWFVDHIQVCPLAVITAPEMRCGKTQLLTVMGRLVARPLTASNITPAALFRAVEMWGPTLLIDEADAFMKDNEELRGVINSGHTRDSAFVIRTVGDDHTPTKFSTWGAKALSGIGRVANTLEDRAIILELRRKLPNEDAERLRHAEPDLFINLRSKLARFAADCGEQVGEARPPLPASLNDRAQDNWEPLLAIAQVAGNNWPEIGTATATALSTRDNASGGIDTELLADIRDVFEMQLVSQISTADLIEKLCKDEERPWATFNKGSRITPRQLASRLRKYGIISTTIRFGPTTPKGYRLEQFTEAFERYLEHQEALPVEGALVNMPKALDPPVPPTITSEELSERAMAYLA